MAFLHGTNTRVYANGYDISAYLTEFSVTYNGEAVDVTTFGATWHDFIIGLKSATFTANGIVDPTQETIINALTNVLGSIWMYFPQGDTVGSYGWAFSAIQTTYNPTSPIGGASTFTVNGTSRVAAELVVSLHAYSAETVDGDSASVDNGASSANGGVGYLEVGAYSGFSQAVFKIQHSPDNAAWADLITFTTVTGANAKERKTVTGTVDRYVQGLWDVTDPGSATFVIGFKRN